MSAAADNEELDALQKQLRNHGANGFLLGDAANDAITALRARIATEAAMRVQCSEDSQAHLDRALAAESQLQQVKADAERIDWLEEAIRKSSDIEYANGIRDALDHEYQRNGGDLRVAIDITRRNDGTA